MRSLVVLFALVAMVSAECGQMARLKVKNQWNQIYGTDHTRKEAGHVMWKAIFALEPKSRDLFKRVNGDHVTSPEFEAHSARVLGGLDIAMSLLDNPADLDAALAHLHTQHVTMGIPSAYFDVFKKVLMEFAPASLGRCFDTDAWSSCFDVIANGIKA